MTTLDPRPQPAGGPVTHPVTRQDSRPQEPVALPGAGERSVAATVRAYLSITKPRVVELLLVTTVPAMILAAEGLPSLWLVLVTLVAGGFAAGSAHAFNQVLERDIDAVMARTAHRPLARDEISVRGAVVFGFVLLALSCSLMLVWVNPLAAALTLAANAFYVVVYTVLLKRRTAQNIVWGGVAGCMPTLIGWAAVTGELAWPPVVLFLIVFFWTPPHYWPLAMRFTGDYARAGVPMLPVVAGELGVARQILAYSVAMVATSLLLVPVASMGWLYTAAAVVAGVWFVGECVRLLRDARAGRTGAALRPMRLFHGSITYLSVVFLAVAVDAAVR